MSSAIPRVLIVGGGPSGLVCALSLIRNGVPVRIIEKSTEPRLGQRGAGIMPRTLEIFTSFGCVEEVTKLAIPPPLTRQYGLPNDTQPIGEFDMSPHIEPTPSCPYNNIVLLGQSFVESILRDTLAKLQCQVENGTELISFEQTENGVNVHLLRHGSDGSDVKGTPEHCTYDWMIGADGARGIVRKMTGFSFLGETRTIENHVVGDVFVEGLSPKYWHMWGDASTMLVSFRPTETPGLFSFVIAGHKVNHGLLSSDEGALRKCFAEKTGSNTSLKFKEIPWVNHYIPNIRMVETFQRGRVFLAGGTSNYGYIVTVALSSSNCQDSAHVHSFTGGQGINTGIQDAYNLCWKLALVQRGLASPALLRTYSEERIPVIREMLDRTTRILKCTFTERASESWNKANGLLQLGINYRWSSVVLDERKRAEDAEFSDFDFDEEDEEEPCDAIDAYGGSTEGTLRAGDRAPDATALVDLSKRAATHRLFNIFTPNHHTVLIFSRALDQCPAIVRTLRELPSDVVRSVVLLRRGQGIPAYCQGVTFVLEDWEGHAHDAYGIKDEWAVAVIRPDGVVGAIIILTTMGNDIIYRLPTYPSTTARKSLSPTELGAINQIISSALLQTIALPPSKRDSPAARAFVASYAKDTALQILQSLIWQSGSTSTSKNDRIIRKRTLILAERIAPVLDTQILLDLAIVYAQTNESKIKTIFQEALKSNPHLVDSVEADFVPAVTHLFNPAQGLYAIRKVTHCVVSFLRASPPEIVRCFSHNQVFVLALGTLYDQGLGSIAQSYGGLSIIRNSTSSTVDEWEPIWVQAKVDLVDAFHIILTSLLNDISIASGPALGVESERTFSIIFALLELPSTSFTASSTPPTPFYNRSLLTDYQATYSLSKTLSIALRNAAEKDARLDLLESTLQSLEPSLPNKMKKRKDAGVLKILIGSSGVAPGIDNRGDGGRVRSTQSSMDSIGIGKVKHKVAQSTFAASSSASVLSVPDIDIKVTQVLDIFPDHAPNYVRALLGHATYGGEPEKVVMALLDGSAPSPEELEAEATVASISDTNDVIRFVNERKNVFDDEVMDPSKLRIGKVKGDASNVLKDKTFIEEMKADILRRAEAISDEEAEYTISSSQPTGIDYAFDEDEDAGVSGIKVAGDGEESGSSDADDDNADDAERPSTALGTETILELAYIKDPKLFDRDGQTRRSKARADLKAQTKWTDEQIEGWRIMLERNPRKDKILQKHEFAGNRNQAPGSVITSSSAGPSGGGRDGGAGSGRGRGGADRRGGRGGRSVRGGADSARERAWKDKNKATHANHNRKKGHDKKMARAGAGVPPP
ncbi:hypothetical protein C0992_004415 [Termitomyces sp. T32_za158]|nr:hypothetical protein C0992_004415 [Termitomyces sp. T32_za158]